MFLKHSSTLPDLPTDENKAYILWLHLTFLFLFPPRNNKFDSDAELINIFLSPVSVPHTHSLTLWFFHCCCSGQCTCWCRVMVVVAVVVIVVEEEEE